jgi:hypothetical protein
MQPRAHNRSATVALRTSSAVLLLLLTTTVIGNDTIKYTIDDWPVDGLGNSRVRVSVTPSVNGPTNVAWAHIPWRRRDAQPERKDIIVIDPTTGKRVANVVRVNINREFGDLLFQPPTVPGEYCIYYMPYRTEGSWYHPSTKYLSPSDTADEAFVSACRPLMEQIKSGKTGQLTSAKVLDIQAINDFHRFDPMEVIATARETKELLAKHVDQPYLLFPEDRRRPIRMTDELPKRWIDAGPGDTFRGEACRGEFYAWQVGVYANGQPLESLAVDPGDLVSDSGSTIPASAIRCFNLAGTDWLGRPIHKNVGVAQGKVQALWFGAEIAEKTNAGTYHGTLIVQPTNAPARQVALILTVSDKVIKDAGDDEIWRHSRLRWLDSTIGLDDKVFAPYTPVSLDGRTVGILGRSVRMADTGMPESITSTFSRNVDAATTDDDAPPRELLAEAMRFVVESADGAPLAWKSDGPTVLSHDDGAITWEAVSLAGPMELVCWAKMECDGYVNFKLTLKTKETTDLCDLRLEIPLRREIATYMMGMGRKGGYRPERWDWKWDVTRSNNQFWIGDVNAGLSCKLKHVEDRWDLFNVQESGIYRDWDNNGKSGCTVEEVGDQQVVVRTSTGPRRVEAGQELHFNFGLLITPVKVLDKNHWQWRYFHRSKAAPVAEAAATGATLINLHQGDGLNPYINYPFLTTEKLSAYTGDAHAKDMKVKIYYTIRELSNYVGEFWALRSLGDEIFSNGPGFRLADQFSDEKNPKPAGLTGSSWLCEHAIDRYVPAWHQPLGNGHMDASIATTGLSRWHNYYIEGLRWLIENVGVDGLYLDGIGYDREIMKRVRKVMQRTRPDCLIDFHSGNHFHPQYGLNNCANLYMELFPFIDSLWFGEGFNYDESPDYWMVEMAGIPYGLFGEMLHGGGNPWRGMLYGMTNRLGWSGDPRHLWKLWDDFGIQDAKMIGYWDSSCPVTTNRDDVLATTYVREGKTLIAVASWAKEPARCPLGIDFAALGLDPKKTTLYAPAIPGIQPEAVFKPTEPLPVLPGRGWMLIADEQPRQVAAAVDMFSGRKTLLEDRFVGKTLAKDWAVTLSKQPGTVLKANDGEMSIEGAANVAAFAQRPLPAGTEIVACSVHQKTDNGASWGPGMTLVWPNDKVLRVNLRVGGRFGVDDGRRQLLEGFAMPDMWTEVVICLEKEQIVVRASQDGLAWQELASFPRGEFSGDPVALRLGKMSPGSENEDFSALGPPGACAIRNLRVFGR